jgi:hypothetical protein
MLMYNLSKYFPNFGIRLLFGIKQDNEPEFKSLEPYCNFFCSLGYFKVIFTIENALVTDTNKSCFGNIQDVRVITQCLKLTDCFPTFLQGNTTNVYPCAIHLLMSATHFRILYPHTV